MSEEIYEQSYEETEEEFNYEIEIITNENKPVETKEKKTTKYMTKYEFYRMIGIRAVLLENNNPPMIDIGNEINSIKIAIEEYKNKKIPLFIRRYLPDGTFEDWNVEELECNFNY